MELREISIDKIKPNPYQARTEFPEENLAEMAATIKRQEIGLLQPISVRKKGEGYELIMGEMRVRASKMAGLKRIPAILKDVDDNGVALQALIENTQRTDLKPMAEARGLFEYYRLAGNFETADVSKIKSSLDVLRNIGTRGLKRKLNDFEKKVKEIADSVGLSYRQQSTLISHLKLDSDEQERVNELEIDSYKLERIATIEGKDARLAMIEIAPELGRNEFSKTVTVLNKAPEHLKRRWSNRGQR
jgi:ParB-like partition proteins